MKTKFFTVILAALAYGAAPLGADEGVGAEPSLPSYTSTGMSCHNCADTVEDALAALDGVEVVSVDPKGNLAVVKCSPGKVTRDKMVAAVKATEEYVVEQTVEYSELEYENDGSFSLDGKPFTGTATDAHKKTANLQELPVQGWQAPRPDPRVVRQRPAGGEKVLQRGDATRQDRILGRRRRAHGDEDLQRRRARRRRRQQGRGVSGCSIKRQ